MKILPLLLAAALVAPSLAHAKADAQTASAATSSVVGADSSAGELDGDVRVVGTRNEEYGFFEKYFPFSTDVQHGATDDAMVGIWIAAAILPFGWLWGPYVFADEKPGGDFAIDAIIVVLVHLLPMILLFIPFVNLIFIIPVWIYLLVNGFYLTPVAIINAYDRSLDEFGGGGGGGKKKSNKRKRRSRRDDEESSLLRPVPSFAATAMPGGATFAY